MPRRSARLAAAFMAILGLAVLAQGSIFSMHDSIDDVRQKIARQPEKGHSRMKAELHDELGTLLYNQGSMEEAAREFEVALTYRITQPVKRHAYVYLGKSYESSGRIDKAISAYEQAAREDPRNWRRYRDLAGLYEQVKLYRRAVEAYQTALAYDSDEASVYYSLGRTWRKMGLYEAAEQCLLKAGRLGLANDAKYELSLVYEGEGEFIRSAEVMEQGLDDHSKPEEWARLVYLAAAGGDKARAGNALRRLKTQKVNRETVRFYEDFIELATAAPQKAWSMKVDPGLESLVKSVESPDPSGDGK